MSAGQKVGPLERESRSLIQPPLPPDEAPRALAAAAGVSPVGLRPSFVTPAAAHSHPDCRGILILIVAPHSLWSQTVLPNNFKKVQISLRTFCLTQRGHTGSENFSPLTGSSTKLRHDMKFEASLLLQIADDVEKNPRL